ncbi:MAG: helix-turn-helix domain-containing protein [Spirosomataceae bacterium]
MKKTPKRRSDCPISFALDIFGDKWSLLIIRDLMFTGKKTYGAFLNSEEKIATNILADRLAMLECAGLIKSRKEGARKSGYHYRLTEKGLDLVPVMLEIIRWGAMHDQTTAAPKEFTERVIHDRENFIKEITDSLKETER